MGRMSTWFGRRRWGRVLQETFRGAERDKVGPVAGGVAFYGLLGLVPAVIALVALAGLILHGQPTQSVVDLLSQSVPGNEGDLIRNQLEPLIEGSSLTLTAVLILGTLSAVWAVSTAVQNAFVTMEVAYGIEKGRGYVRNRGISLLFTLGALAMGLILVLALVALPSIAQAREFAQVARFAVGWGRWPVLAAAVFGAYLFVYRFGVRRKGARTRRLLWGAAFATVIWVLGSILFTVWITYVANYKAFYGTLSTLVVAMVWLLLSGFALILGAEMNVVLERGEKGENIWVKDRADKGEAVADSGGKRSSGPRSHRNKGRRTRDSSG